jgi:hypothetical protein
MLLIHVVYSRLDEPHPPAQFYSIDTIEDKQKYKL